MAVKDPRTGSPFSNTSTNPGTGIAATGSVTVSTGDLIFVNVAARGALTSPAITDNLGNTYRLLATPGSGNGRAYGFYAVASAGGTLTTVTAAHSSTTNDVCVIVAVFEGPFYAQTTTLDKLPAMAADSTSPFTATATGTLTFSDELIIGYMAQGDGADVATYGANNSFTVHGEATTGTGASTVSGAICYLKVSATTTQTPEFTNATSTSASLGTVSFVVAQPEVRVSKLNAYSVMLVDGVQVSKVNAYAVLDDPRLQVSKLNAYAVLIESSANRRRQVYTTTH